MPIPHDPLKRWWVEASGVNPTHVNDLRPTLFAFLAFGRSSEPSLAGSGFIIAANEEFALILTAKHVLLEGVLRAQRPEPRHASSSLFVPGSHTQPSIDPKTLKAIWMGDQHANAMNVIYVSYNNSLDIACCLVSLQDHNDSPFHPIAIPINVAVPNCGDVVHLVSRDTMKVEELIAPSSDFCRQGQLLHLYARISIRVGIVTGVYPNGFRQYKWPCFTTSIPAEPGMSGGFVTLPESGKTISACGVICADNSTPEARLDQSQCGVSVIACTWPSLSLAVPESISSNGAVESTIFRMMKEGKIDPAVGGFHKINMIKVGTDELVITHL